MTPEERTNPQLLNGSRRKRIADGSGTCARGESTHQTIWTNGQDDEDDAKEEPSR